MDIGAQVVGPCFHLCKQTGDLRVKTPGLPLAKILHISGMPIFMLTLIRMTKDEKVLAIFKGLLL